MACPWFLPQTPVRDARAATPPRLPLGELWTGLCCAPGQNSAPAGIALRHACNTGYARAVCSRFPADAETEALRFHVVSENGDLIRLQYVYERQWWPAEHGALEYSPVEGRITSPSANEVLNAQARAFAQSWLYRCASQAR